MDVFGTSWCISLSLDGQINFAWLPRRNQVLIGRTREEYKRRQANGRRWIMSISKSQAKMIVESFNTMFPVDWLNYSSSDEEAE